jgi:hypothetical protein
MTTTLRSWKGEERPTVVAEGPDPKRSGTCMRVEECSVSISLLVICGAKNASHLIRDNRRGKTRLATRLTCRWNDEAVDMG